MRTIVALSKSLSKAQADKLDAFALTFNSAMHKFYVDYVVKKIPFLELKRNYISNFNLNARHVNSIKFSIDGITSSILSLNKDYLSSNKSKLFNVRSQLKKELIKLNNSKILNDGSVADNIIISAQSKFRKKITYLKKREQSLIKKIAINEDIIKSGNPHLCFGSKKLMKQRTTGMFQSHASWRDEWNFQRNKSTFFVGSSDETAGNLNAQIRHIKNDDFAIKLNVNPNAQFQNDKYLELFFSLNYEKEAIKKIIKDNLNGTGKDNLFKQSLTFRITKEKNSKKRENQYIIAISFDKNKFTQTQSKKVTEGCIGVDINQNHLAISETNSQGNIIKSYDSNFDATGTVHQNINDISLSVKRLINIAKASNKSIVIEQLDFSKKKEELRAGINKKRNVQLSSFSYAKIKSLIKARAGDAGIEVLEVNPAYTSVIGRAKYSKRLGISVHRAAAYAIARRGMNKKEKETVFQLKLAESERKMLEKHNGNAYWKKVQELIRANKKTLSQESQVV